MSMPASVSAPRVSRPLVICQREILMGYTVDLVLASWLSAVISRVSAPFCSSSNSESGDPCHTSSSAYTVSCFLSIDILTEQDLSSLCIAMVHCLFLIGSFVFCGFFFFKTLFFAYSGCQFSIKCIAGEASQLPV